MNSTMRAHLGLKTGLDFSGSPVEADRTGKGINLPFSELTGRLTELSGQGSHANLTLACDFVFDAQKEGETTVWVTGKESSFYPPDATERGIDLSALAVVRCPDRRDCARVADRLARSGAFGLLIIDLGAKGDVSPPLQSHLAGLARTHHMAVIFLTEKPDDAPSLGSLVSLRGRTLSRRMEAGLFTCTFKTLKDKRRAPGWIREGVYHGTPGLC
ncbi:MAG: recombinase A [Syntrophorhabdus sp. PtaB.Bin184]|nr:MAG: recombinase A [Syntrophorhabdus sp. PtaB.Bin184]